MTADHGAAARQAFLEAVANHFLKLSRRLGNPYTSAINEASNGVGFSVWEAGNDDPVLHIDAGFEDDAFVFQANGDVIVELEWDDEAAMAAYDTGTTPNTYASLRNVDRIIERSLAPQKGPSRSLIPYRANPDQEKSAAPPSLVSPAAIPAPSGGPAPQLRLPTTDEVSERVIAALLSRMQAELLNHEASLVRAGAATSLKARTSDLMDWAMVSVAFAAEAKTNQTAIASFIPGEASWVYGLVGPVLIGGLASISKTRIGKASALTLMLTWALAMATVTASNKSYLDGAQSWFSKSEAVTRSRTVSGSGACHVDGRTARK